jgi:hypothetical protein
MNSISERANATQDEQNTQLPIVNKTTKPAHDEAQDHENEEETRRRLEEWRSMAANLSGGFTQMPDQVRKDSTLSTSAKIVYEHLLGYMWSKEWCWPSQQRIASELGISRRTVIRACKELYARCYIEKWRRGLGRTNVYFINPLSFVCSFKRSGRGAGVLLVAGGPEHQAHVSTTPAPDVTLSYMVQCQIVTSRSDKVAHPEAPESHLKHTKEKEIQKKDRYSNDSTAEKGTAIASTTIGNEQPNSSPNGEGTNTNRPSVSTPSKSNNQSNGIKQTAAAPAKAAKQAKAGTQGQPSAQAQAIAAATGIPAAHLSELGIAQEPPRRPVPDFIANMMKDFTRDLGDSPRSAKSNVTRATKLYYFACDYIVEAQDDPEGFYIKLLYQARAAAFKVNNIHHSTGSRSNRIPVFFTCLENLFALTDDERAYVRSDLPLLYPEDRGV